LTPVLVFDIETIPDTAGIARTLDLDPDQPAADIAELAMLARRQSTGNDFLPHYQQRVVAISCALKTREQFFIWTLGREGESEKDILQRFFDGIDRYTPRLVSWNGSGFDLPVLHLRGLLTGVRAPRYWEWGDEDRDFKYNNYLSRFHTRHLDLMDVLAAYQPRANAPLDALAKMLGLPGKLGMDGSQVWPAWRDGKLADICDYCETDVVNTYLLFLRFERMRGALDDTSYEAAVGEVRDFLAASEAGHWREFLAAWEQ
jgi:predicted PolB exonuclease-like 3'-5' exonuclease